MEKLTPIIIHRTEKTVFGESKTIEKTVSGKELKLRVEEVINRIGNDVNDLTLLQMAKISAIIEEAFVVDDTENYKKLCSVFRG